MAPRGIQLALVLSLLLAGCDGCDEDPQVPFGMDTDATGPEDPQDTSAEKPAFEARDGRTFADGTPEVSVQGAPLRVEEGRIHALLDQDLDGDGDRDALLVVAREGDALLTHARREGSRFTAPEILATLPGGEGCEIAEARVRTVSSQFGVATVAQRCEERTTRTLGIVSLEEPPRLLERIALLPQEGRAPGAVAITLHAVDHDEDGHTDVMLDVEVRPEGAAGEPATASIAWLDRPGGLARDTAEPEQAVAALAQEAEQALRTDADAALAKARAALALHAVLCREAGAPRLRFGDSEGLPCRASAGAGRAAAVAVAALARQGDVFAALDAAARLDGDAYRVSAADRRRAEQALSAMAVAPVSTEGGPEVRTPAAPDVHLPVIGLPAAGTLLVRGDDAHRHHLGGAEEDAKGPAPAEGSVLVSDPTGRWAVVDVERRCEGYVLAIARASEVVAGVVAGQVVHTPLLEAALPPAGSRCPDGALSATARADDGGWEVVGWAPQGVVAVRRAEMRLVPLTVEAEAAGTPEPLDAQTPPPVPLPPGQIAPDGSAYAIPTPWGIVVRRLSPTPRVTLVQPEGWAAADERLPPVAVAPDGTHVAYVENGTARVATVRW